MVCIPVLLSNNVVCSGVVLKSYCIHFIWSRIIKIKRDLWTLHYYVIEWLMSDIFWDKALLTVNFCSNTKQVLTFAGKTHSDQ